MKASDTAQRLLDAAQLLVQERGFNAFSYKDLAGAIGIRTASIHYHFPAKAELGLALMKRYLGQLEQALAKLERQDCAASSKLEGFIALYRATARRKAICLCGSLASDLETLPQDLRRAVRDYLRRSEAWVADRIDDGVEAGEFECEVSSAELAASLIAGLQGALILARGRGGAARILDGVERSFFSALGVA